MRPPLLGLAPSVNVGDLRLTAAAEHVELMKSAMLGPRLVQLTDGVGRLDAKAPKRKQNRAHSDDRPHLTATMGTTGSCSCVGSVTESHNLVQGSLELLPKFDDTIPRQIGSPGPAKLGDHLAKPCLGSVPRRHHALPNLLLSGEHRVKLRRYVADLASAMRRQLQPFVRRPAL